MITLTKNGNAIVFTFEDNAHYLFDGTISVPINSLTLITDNSQMATFKKSASNDIFISATYAELGMSKAELESWFKENACGSTGGGGGVTSGEVETMIEASLEDYYDIDEVDAALSGKADTSAVTEAISSAVSGKVNTSAFNTYSAATDSRIAEDEEVTAAALNDLQENKADTSAVTQSLSTKQDALEYYSENEIEDSESGESDKYGQIEISDELNGAHVYVDFISSDEEKSPYASIDAWVNDGEGNEKQNRVYADADGVGISADENADDGEGNILYVAANVSVTPTEIGMNVSEEGDTSTTLSITSTDVTINGDAVATEPYVDAAISGKADTSAVTAISDSLSGYVQTSAVTTSVTSGSTDSEIPTAKAVYDAIPTGGTGGTTYSAGTNISIDSANTISCTIPAYFGTNTKSEDIRIGTDITNGDISDYSLLIGRKINKGGLGTSYKGIVALCVADQNSALNNFYGRYLIGIGRKVSFGTSTTNRAEYSVGIGDEVTVYGNGNVAIGAVASTSGSSSVAIGSGATANGSDYKMNLNNQIKVDTNNQVYIKDKTNTTDVCIQDAIAALGGLKFVKLSQSEYDQLATKDANTLYIISNVVS